MLCSLTPSRSASRRSENPLRLRRRNCPQSSAAGTSPSSAASSRTRSSICTRNQRSIEDNSCISSSVKPARKPSARYHSREAPGLRISPRRRATASSSNASTCGSNPAEPTSRPRIAFCNDSWKVRPIAITSPTDFIWVVRRASAVANFSKVNRGTLVTT